MQAQRLRTTSYQYACCKSGRVGARQSARGLRLDGVRVSAGTQKVLVATTEQQTTQQTTSGSLVELEAILKALHPHDNALSGNLTSDVPSEWLDLVQQQGRAVADEIATLRSDVAQKTAELQRVRDMHARESRELTAAKAALGDAQRELEALAAQTSRLRALQQQLDSHTRHLSTLQRDLKQLNDAQSNAAALQQLRDELKKKETELVKSRKENASLKNTAGKRGEAAALQLSEAESTIEALRFQLQQQSADLTAAQQQCQQLRAELAAMSKLEASLHEKDNELTAAQQRIGTLQKQLEDATTAAAARLAAEKEKQKKQEKEDKEKEDAEKAAMVEGTSSLKAEQEKLQALRLQAEKEAEAASKLLQRAEQLAHALLQHNMSDTSANGSSGGAAASFAPLLNLLRGSPQPPQPAQPPSPKKLDAKEAEELETLRAEVRRLRSALKQAESLHQSTAAARGTDTDDDVNSFTTDDDEAPLTDEEKAALLAELEAAKAETNAKTSELDSLRERMEALEEQMNTKESAWRRERETFVTSVERNERVRHLVQRVADLESENRALKSTTAKQQQVLSRSRQFVNQYLKRSFLTPTDENQQTPNVMAIRTKPLAPTAPGMEPAAAAGGDGTADVDAGAAVKSVAAATSVAANAAAAVGANAPQHQHQHQHQPAVLFKKWM